MNTKTPCLIGIVGPTAVGKTALAIQIAQHFQTEIISADSRQFYKELNIGTAKPSPEELALVKHHFIDSHSIAESYSVGQFEKDALEVLHQIFQTHSVAVMVGGSGLYVQVVWEGMDAIPETDPEIRTKLIERLEREGLEVLVEELKKWDFTYFQEVDTSNPQRVMRALEVCLSTGSPYSSFRKKTKVQRDFRILKIGLERDRAELYQRIDERMDAMLAQGLLEEAKTLFLFASHNALQTVGYQEIFGFLREEYDWEETVRLLKRNSRRYAKRQMTWFRKDSEIRWFEADNQAEILAYIQKSLEDI